MLFLDSGPGNPAFNMALDEALLEEMPRLNQGVLRFYGWTEPAASFGYFQKYREVERWTALRPLVRRPTAGGLVPHDADWTYSLAFPPAHEWYWLAAPESYRRLHAWLQRAFALLGLETVLAPEARKTAPGQCFAGHEQSDLLWKSQKLAGAAQRRRRDGLLIQGSVQPRSLASRQEWQRAMLRTAPTGAEGWTELAIHDSLAARARALAESKYSQPAYNQRR